MFEEHTAGRRKKRRRSNNGSSDWIAKTSGHCFYCGSIQRLTRDHIIPRSKGGGTFPCNIVAACSPCNGEKGRLSLEEYRAALAYRSHVSHDAFRFWGETAPASVSAPASAPSGA